MPEDPSHVLAADPHEPLPGELVGARLLLRSRSRRGVRARGPGCVGTFFLFFFCIFMLHLFPPSLCCTPHLLPPPGCMPRLQIRNKLQEVREAQDRIDRDTRSVRSLQTQGTNVALTRDVSSTFAGSLHRHSLCAVQGYSSTTAEEKKMSPSRRMPTRTPTTSAGFGSQARRFFLSSNPRAIWGRELWHSNLLAPGAQGAYALRARCH